MNPNSKDAIAERLALHREAVVRRDRLAAEAKCDSSLDAEAALARAETDVRAGLSRMEAMGDPIPAQASTPFPNAGVIDPPATPPPAAVRPAPTAGIPSKPIPAPAVDPVDATVARIIRA